MPRNNGPAPACLLAQELVEELIQNEEVEVSDHARELMVEEVWKMVDQATADLYESLFDNDFVRKNRLSEQDRRDILRYKFGLTDEAVELAIKVIGVDRGVRDPDKCLSTILYSVSGLRSFGDIED